MTQVKTNTPIQNQNINKQINTVNTVNNDKINQDKKLSWRNRGFYQCKEMLLEHGRKGMIIQNLINVGFFGLMFLGIRKVGILRNQQRVLRTVVNLALTGVLYQAIWPVRTQVTNKAVPAVMNLLNLKATQDEKKSIKEMFEKFESQKGNCNSMFRNCGPFGCWNGRFGEKCEIPCKTEEKKKDLMLSQAGISKNLTQIKPVSNEVKK